MIELTPPDAALIAIVDREIAACRAILAATEAIEAALEPLDLDAVEAGLAERARQFAALAALEGEAEALRGRVGLDQATPALAEGLAELRALSARVRDADARAQAGAAQVLAGIEQEIRTVNRGQGGLRSYRGLTGPEPRFADRKG